ncbi:hypothetical protein L8P91_10040 [Enterobacter bugandensis]|uniref:hypothetical protein n=1 Tax=Enterobacter bugandensis TaxID=881260 RepID=UPI00200427A8|nr:hypothetical protein [Enterobacter bugandensis]MCK7066536.1 hypothetical protein [Enterobacter bugandensis]
MKTINALVLFLALPAYADNKIDFWAQENVNYDSVIFKLKKEYFSSDQEKTSLEKNKINSGDAELTATPLYDTARKKKSNALLADKLDEKYGFNRYYQLILPENKRTDTGYINNLLVQLENEDAVEVVYPNIKASSLNKSLPESAESEPDQFSNDFTSKQYYLRAPDDIASRYKIGGVNADFAWMQAGGKGENITVVSQEIGAWNDQHNDLPPYAFTAGKINVDSHDTASVGIMAARDNGFGVTGIANKATFGYAQSGASVLYDLMDKLKAGDVVQVGIEVVPGSIGGCNSNCAIPMEYMSHWYDEIRALTDSGIHVIEAAGNGNVNLDHPDFRGKFDRNKRDSGAIIVGALSPQSGGKASFSTWGTRIDSASWGGDVTSTTTGNGDLSSEKNNAYTSSFSGTSSANPIVAGAVASLSGVAKANKISLKPTELRQILSDTGTPLAGNDSSKIGTQPDLERAIKQLLNDTEAHAPVVTLDRTSLSVVATTNTGFGYLVSANSSQDDVTWTWELAEGNKNIYLKSYDKSTAEIVVPKQHEDHISDMYAKFKVSAMKNGKTGHSYVTIHVVKPAVSITGDSHMSPANPAKLTAIANFDQATYDWTLKRNGQSVSDGIDASGQIAKNLPGGDYTAEVSARSDKGGRKASAEYKIKVEEQAQNNDQAFINALSLSMQSTDNGDSVTFSGNVASSSAATSTPGYAWTLPAGAQGGSNGQPQQRFTVTKNKQVQNLKVKVKVTAGKEMRELERDITVPAQTETGQYPLYKPGTDYKAGDVVKNKNGDLFECKPWPYTAWCGSSSALHYEPGIGLNWKDAWNSK